MPRFLFWNLAGKFLSGMLADLALERSLDVLVLAECQMPAGMLLEALNRDSSDFYFCPGNCSHITIFTRFPDQFLTPVSETARVSIRRLLLPARQELLLVAAHLPTRLHFDADSLNDECSELSRMILLQELASGHKRTLLLGDLNLNPFERGVVSTQGLHGVMSRSLAARRRRTVQGRQYEFFYNPMWTRLGDGHPGPAGTYFYEKHEHISYFWNIFDQVLLRPDLLAGYDDSQLEIVSTINGKSLLDDQGRPSKRVASDHLPVVINLNF